MRTLLWCVLLAAPAAPAQVFDLVLPARFNLGPAAPAADGELLVERNVARAAHGIRLAESSAGFKPTEVLEPGQYYVVRDAQGRLYRLHVGVNEAATSRVELVKLGGTQDFPAASAALGRYQNVGVRIDGQEAEPVFGSLELKDDGRYRQGTVTGRWSWARGQLLLEGAWAHWGKASYDPDARTLRFTFQRNRLEWEVTFALKPEGRETTIARQTERLGATEAVPAGTR